MNQIYIVSVVRGGKVIQKPTALDICRDDADVHNVINNNFTFADIFASAVAQLPALKNFKIDDISNISIKGQAHSHNADPIQISNAHISSQLCEELHCKFIEYELREKSDCCDATPTASSSQTHSHNNAFSLMMSAQKQLLLPEKPIATGKEKLSGPQRLYSDIIDWASDLDCGWTPDLLDTGKRVLGKLSNALWYVDHCHNKFERNGCPIPKVFQQFSGYNQFSKHHHKVPVLSSEKLGEVSTDLFTCLSLPSMTLQRHKQLSGHIDSLALCLTNYKKRLQKDNIRQQTIYQVRDQPARSPVSDSTCMFISPKPSVDEQFSALDMCMRNMDSYSIVDLDQFSPSDRYDRRKYIQELRLSRPTMMYRMAYGGSVGTLSFIWAVPPVDSPERTEKNANVLAEINSQLPKFSSRSMRRDFINKYSSHVKISKAVLRHMYHELSSTEPVSENKETEMVDDRIAQILLEADDPQLLLDYRSLNGKKLDSKFEVFFDEIQKYFDEQLLPVHERRHTEELYLPLAISIEDLKEQVAKRVPSNTPIPSSEMLRLQFMPSNPFQTTALKYSGRFNVKFKVQTRQARVSHADGRYVATLFRYLKEFCVKMREACVFVCLDDKAIIPVGEPGIHISTGVRGHNKVLAPSEGANLVAADHDFHVGGIVPSVALVSEIPYDANDSFFSGSIYVTTKDKVFEPSNPFRHATELIRILRDHHSDDDVNLNAPILCMMTDGGPDHRITFESVKTSLVQIFMQLDLDMLVAIRTAPNHSWVNPAERCMSILNLALQHVSLARNSMDKKFEDMIKNKSSLTGVRNTASTKPELKTAFGESINPVIETVNSRFARMKLKGNPLIVYRGVSEEAIDESISVVRQTTGASGSIVNMSATSKELRDSKELQVFMKKHSTSNHYSFQLRKCHGEDPCKYCLLNPIRLTEDIFRDLHLLPCPVPDDNTNGTHYQSFQELYGKELDASHRPSMKNTTDFDDMMVEFDKQNRDILKAIKVRDAISCGECNKPRLIYSANKLNREQEEHIRRLKEDGQFVCGNSMPWDCGFITRGCLSCTSDVEIAYYGSTVRGYFPPCCVYCGSVEDLLDDNNEHIEMLLQQYSVVRPLCFECRRRGLNAKTWGKKFFKKRKT